MMELVTALLGATGLAVAAGLNAYIPLLLISGAARYLPGGWFVLSPEFEFVRSNWFFGLVLFLLIVEILADKIPIVDHVNDVIQTIIRPAAGAVLFASGTGIVAHIDPWLAMGLGFIAAGSVHGAKMAFRPLVTVTTGGTGNAIVSTIEDAVSLFVTILALVAPVVILAVLVLGPFFIFRWISRRKRQRAVSGA